MDKIFLQIYKDTVYVVLKNAGEAKSSYYPVIYIVLAFITGLLIIFNFRKIKHFLEQVKPKEYEIDIPGFKIKGDLQYTSLSQSVSWKIYVELITRVTANTLEESSGILRDSLNSIYQAFVALRETLKNSDAALAKEPGGDRTYSVSSLLLVIMNQQMRPFLSKWNPLLQEYELKRKPDISQYEHEKNWDYNEAFRLSLKTLQQGLNEYIQTIKSIAEGKQK